MRFIIGRKIKNVGFSSVINDLLGEFFSKRLLQTFDYKEGRTFFGFTFKGSIV